MKWPTRDRVKVFFICESRLFSRWKIPKWYQLSGEKRVKAFAFIVDKTTYLNKVTWYKENVNYYATYFLMWRPFEAKMSLLHKHTCEQNLSQFPFYKTAFASSTSPCDWQALKDKFVGIIQQLQNACSSRLHMKAIETRMFQNILLPLVLIWFQCRCTWI